MSVGERGCARVCIERMCDGTMTVGCCQGGSLRGCARTNPLLLRLLLLVLLVVVLRKRRAFVAGRAVASAPTTPTSSVRGRGRLDCLCLDEGTFQGTSTTTTTTTTTAVTSSTSASACGSSSSSSCCDGWLWLFF